MAQVELTSKDTDALLDILQKHFSELRWEIAFTHKRDMLNSFKTEKSS